MGLTGPTRRGCVRGASARCSTVSTSTSARPLPLKRSNLMRTVIARIFDYSIDGVIGTEDTPFFDFCRDLPDDEEQVERNQALYAGADLHIMGRAAYQGMSGY